MCQQEGLEELRHIVDYPGAMGLLTDTKLNDNLTTVPEPVRNYLELASGDRVEWHVEEGQIIVRKKDQG